MRKSEPITPSGVIFETDSRLWKAGKKIRVLFPSLDMVGFQYCVDAETRTLIRFESCRNGIVCGKKVNRSGVTTNAAAYFSLEKTEVYAVSVEDKPGDW
jgi:hypothetical protein